MNIEKMNASSAGDAGVSRCMGMSEGMSAHGTYHAQCFDKDGNLKWEDDVENLVTTVGKNLALDMILQGTPFVAVYMGLIATATPVPVVGDTMSSHASWTEAGTGIIAARLAPSFTTAAAGGSKSTTSAVSFSIVGSGTIGGCLLVMGTGASATIATVTGTLYSAGAFAGGNKTVSNGDTLNVTYTATM